MPLLSFSFPDKQEKEGQTKQAIAIGKKSFASDKSSKMIELGFESKTHAII